MKTGPTFAAVLPYAVWMSLMFALPVSAATYAIRSALALAALALFLPALAPHLATRGGAPRHGRAASCVVGVLAGLAVCALWIAPESIPAYRDFSLLRAVGLAGADAPQNVSPYDPELCGWPLTAVKLLGSAFVIAPIEELFFRSFLYRWLQRSDWTKVDPRRFDVSAFVWMVGLFALEHHTRLAAGAMAGAFYGIVAIRRGLGAAVVAHVTTNLALGIYVVATESWAFW